MLNIISKRCTQTVFWLFVIIFITLVLSVAINFFTGGALRAFIENSGTSSITKEVSIGLAQPLNSFSPLSFQFQNRVVLNNVFEGLVRLDQYLKVRPALATTYGKLDDTHYQFRIRKGVLFHDGTELTNVDIVNSFNRAMNDAHSELTSVLSNVKSIKSSDTGIEIELHTSDPIFLQKLAQVYIYKEHEDMSTVGTGPYMIGDQTFERVELLRHDQYWGAKPEINIATFEYLQEKELRTSRYLSGEFDVIRDLSVSMYDELKSKGSLLVSQPSLELTFMGFGQNIRANRELVHFIQSSLNVSDIARTFGPIVEVATQFVTSGVIGYVTGYNPPSDSDTLNPITLTTPLTLTYDESLNELARLISLQLTEAGLELILQPMQAPDFLEALRSGSLELYILGWKFDFGDAGGFYKSVVMSGEDGYGEFNAGGYENERVNELVLESDKLNEAERIKKLQEIMTILLETDPFGIPLLETRVIYAIGEHMEFIPRIDGFMQIAEMDILQ